MFEMDLGLLGMMMSGYGQIVDENAAIIIVNYNSRSMLARALKAVSDQTVLPGLVMVIDNASKDGSADGLTNFGLNLEIFRMKENLGFAAANNFALQRLTQKWVVLLNPDCYPERKWLERLILAAEANPGVASFGSKLILEGDRNILDGYGDAYHASGLYWRMGHRKPASEAPKIGIEIFSPCAAAALYNREMVAKVGKFDERFFCYGEDVDLGFRLRLAGYSSKLVPDAIAFHEGSAIAGYRSDFSVYYGHRNLVWVYLKNMPLSLLLITLPIHFLMTLLLMPGMLWRGQFWLYLKAKFDALASVGPVLNSRKEIQARRHVSVGNLLRMIQLGFGGR